MRAVVLVGGFGTRLRPLTSVTPKQMLPVLHRPMIEHVLCHLARHGVDDVVLSMGYRADAFSNAYPDGTCSGVVLHYAVEPEPLDTAGAIRFAAHHAGIDGRFLVMNADVLTDLDIGALIQFHEDHEAEATIALHKVEDPSVFGVVPTDQNDRVTAFVEKPPRDEAPTDLINAGIYVMEPSVLDRIPGDRRVSIERETFPVMATDGTLYAMNGDSYWIDTGTPATYLQAQIDLLSGVRGDGGKGIHADAHVDSAATVDRSIVGSGAVIGAGAVLRRSLVMAGASVGAGTVVEDSIVATGAWIGEKARLVNTTVVGDGEVVADGEDLDGIRRPAPDG
jgi:mannose-1-phosphate guanylyltransferase